MAPSSRLRGDEREGDDADERAPLLINAAPRDSASSTTRGGDGEASAKEKAKEEEKPWSLRIEIKTVLLLAIPIFVVVCAWVGMKVTDTAVLGHVGTEYLSAASLSDIYTTSTAFLIGGRVLSTFVGQAYGAKNYRLAGIWLNVSLVITGILCIPVIISWNLTTFVLAAFGKHEDINHNAAIYSSILSISLPARVLFSQVSAFFQAQQIVKPSVYVAIICLLYNLLMNLFVTLGVGIKGFSGVGFIGCPVVTTTATLLQPIILISVFVLWKKLHVNTWFGFFMSEVTWVRCKRYLGLYLPAILMYGSEFWRFNLIGVLAATLGDTQVAAFNASYKIIYIVHQFAIAVGQASSIRTGLHLGAEHPHRAKTASWIGASVAGIISGALGVIVYFTPRAFGHIFSSDPDILDIFEDIRLYLALTIFTMSVSDTMESILVAQGRSTAVAVSTTFVSWGVHVPACFVLVHKWRHDMVGLYLGLTIGYSALTIISFLLLFFSNWDKLVVEAKIRAEKKTTAQNAAAAKEGTQDDDGRLNINTDDCSDGLEDCAPHGTEFLVATSDTEGGESDS